MNSDAFKDIEKLETDLWEAADNLRANSKLTSSDYFMPVLGVIFLRHAANRFDAAHKQIEADQASGKMPRRKVLPADYIAHRSLYLPEKARYDWIMQQAAVSGADLPKLVTDAMTAVEAEFEPLLGVLPKDYGIFETNVLEDLMRVFNSEQIKRATGDVFGRIYEYFLAKFSIQKAHDNGEFFTPSSIVQTIVNVIEPDHGTVFDPAHAPALPRRQGPRLTCRAVGGHSGRPPGSLRPRRRLHLHAPRSNHFPTPLDIGFSPNQCPRKLGAL